MIINDICQVLEQKPDSLCFGFVCLSIHGKLAVMPVVPTTLVRLFLFKRRNFPSAGFFDGQPYESHTVQKVCDNFLSQSRFSDIVLF
jgi:hypothetical protein